MNAAIVLFMDSPSLQQQAAEIYALLKDPARRFSSVELWLFYKGAPPERFPAPDCSISAVRLVAVRQDDHLPESRLQMLSQLADRFAVELILFPSDGLGMELATRLAYRLSGSACLQVLTYGISGHTVTVTKPVYGSNLRARFRLTAPPYCSVHGQTALPADTAGAAAGSHPGNHPAEHGAMRLGEGKP